ncbi:sugar ABC transporter ATP-binding protein [Telmatocola sphagniphila]|uniref:Sugar ABC transporter ATP-binding protein n=1 Tax=Telmatocola sphagniphila TaxID=1123043 RepID=A0A8E6B7Y1_9BACT|nr:sugar ABC transporter ATP-binding protein [Telmatocola sphagniphila]QVL32919.1 sugar ABC transporter ATP-binding protein [Telmatocola sphagniphila]
MNSLSPILEVREVRKEFPGVLALDNVSLKVYPGEVLALVGENGAGKSTLMKILAGVYSVDEGDIYVDGQLKIINNVNDALKAGVSLIHQELNLAENLSVASNLFLGREIRRGGIWLNQSAMRDASRKLLKRVGLDESIVNQTVSTLAPGQKQLVEIARALSFDARIIIMDEPTSSLTQKETDTLYTVIDDLKDAGVTIIYISHRLAEVKRCADRVVVLRDGKNAGEIARENISHDTIIKYMVGRDLKNIHPRSERFPGETILELKNVVYRGGPETPVSFKLRAGEITGMAGLVGAGRTELAEALFGIRPIIGGEVSIDSENFQPHHPSDSVERGLLLVPEDRRKHGLILERGSGFNISLPSLPSLSAFGFLKFKAEQALNEEFVTRLRVKTPNLFQPVGFLSGGNQQKVVLAKWLARNPKVLILDEPTRGVDVGARQEIYQNIDNLVQQGIAILMISSDMEEVLGMSDRILVLHEGRLTGELERDQFSEEAVMNLATGFEKSKVGY